MRLPLSFIRVSQSSPSSRPADAAPKANVTSKPSRLCLGRSRSDPNMLTGLPARSCRWRILGLSKVFWRKEIRALVLAEEQTENSVALSAGC